MSATAETLLGCKGGPLQADPTNRSAFLQMCRVHPMYLYHTRNGCEFARSLSAAIKAEALREAADATYEHTNIGQDNRRTVTPYPIFGERTRMLLRQRADEIGGAA